MSPFKRIAVGMSGGSDSSLAAAVLKEQGHDLVGITLRLWKEPSGKSSEYHIRRAAAVCEKIGIEHYVFDHYDFFREHVVNPFVASYQNAKTPSPCVVCNKQIKFGSLLDDARKIGCDAVATGHFACLEKSEGRVRLKRGIDPKKDQSYFLSMLSTEQLQHAVFPLGEMLKTEVKEQARERGFVSDNYSESQDLCFIPDDDYAAFLERNSDVKLPGNGPILDLEGNKLGEHKGYYRYTLGQRSGLGLSQGPWYVVRLCAESNTVVVGRKEDLGDVGCSLRDVNWIDPCPALDEAVECSLQLRYRMKAVSGRVLRKDNVTLVLPNELVSAVTPGQAAVFYDGDYVIGSGWIDEVLKRESDV